MEGEFRWRVSVERQQSGWVEVSAPDEATARSRAKEQAERDWWYPEIDHVSTSECECERDKESA
jgi:hypothetical protein